jgi:acetyl esterase/lipase
MSYRRPAAWFAPCVLVLGPPGLALFSAATPPSYPDHARLLVYRDAGGKEHPVRTAADWARRRAHVLAAMQEVMGPLPGGDRKVPLDVRVAEEVKGGRFVRKKITFAVEKGDRVPAYLFLPLGAGGKAPAVLCLHQTNGDLGKKGPAGLGDRPNLFYALHLAERGYVTLAPDYPNFGEYKIDVYARGYQSASLKAVWNNMRALDLLQALPEVDAEKIGCLGHSLGGHNTMFTAAFDERVKALVSSCGFTSFPKYFHGNLQGWSHKGYMPRIASAYDLKPEKVPFDFPEVVASFAPRAFLACAPLGDDNFEVSGVKDCIAAARPVYELLGAGDKLNAVYPDGKHDFPPEVRKVAYAWLDRWLK